MKRTTISAILSFILLLSFTGCGVDSTNENKSNDKNQSSLSTLNKSEDTTIKFEEKEATEGTSSTSVVEREVRLYHYDAVKDEIIYENTSINVTDGALVSAIIDALKVDKGSEYCTLNSNVAVRSAKLDKDNDLLTVNFGENFVNNMNLGSGPELSFLQCIVNSLGYNFKVSNILITVNGESYSSGHIQLEEGDSFPVDYSNTKELK